MIKNIRFIVLNNAVLYPFLVTAIILSGIIALLSAIFTNISQQTLFWWSLGVFISYYLANIHAKNVLVKNDSSIDVGLLCNMEKLFVKSLIKDDMKTVLHGYLCQYAAGYVLLTIIGARIFSHFISF